MFGDGTENHERDLEGSEKMMSFGQESKKERYCGKCVSEGKHKLNYVFKGNFLKKEIKPKIIGGRCERCMKGNLIDLKI